MSGSHHFLVQPCFPGHTKQVKGLEVCLGIHGIPDLGKKLSSGNKGTSVQHWNETCTPKQRQTELGLPLTKSLMLSAQWLQPLPARSCPRNVSAQLQLFSTEFSTKFCWLTCMFRKAAHRYFHYKVAFWKPFPQVKLDSWNSNKITTYASLPNKNKITGTTNPALFTTYQFTSLGWADTEVRLSMKVCGKRKEIFQKSKVSCFPHLTALLKDKLVLLSFCVRRD